MKKVIFISIFILALAISGCSTDSPLYEIQFDSQNGNEIITVQIDANNPETIPESPEKTGFTFDGWYWDEGQYTESFTINSILNSPLSSDMKVYAKWDKVAAATDYQFLNFYNLEVEASGFEGSYEEWLETIRGPQGLPGQDGMTVQFRIENEFLQWQYLGDEEWMNLLNTSALQGLDGTDGIDGMNGTNGIDGINGVDGMNGSDGIDGKQIELRNSEGVLEWKYTDESNWIYLLDTTLTESPVDTGDVEDFFIIAKLGTILGDSQVFRKQGWHDVYSLNYDISNASTLQVVGGDAGKSTFSRIEFQINMNSSFPYLAELVTISNAFSDIEFEFYSLDESGNMVLRYTITIDLALINSIEVDTQPGSWENQRVNVGLSFRDITWTFPDEVEVIFGWDVAANQEK